MCSSIVDSNLHCFRSTCIYILYVYPFLDLIVLPIACSTTPSPAHRDVSRAVRQLYRSPIFYPLWPRFGYWCGPGPTDTLLWLWPYGCTVVARPYETLWLAALCTSSLTYPHSPVPSLIVDFLSASPPASYFPSLPSRCPTASRPPPPSRCPTASRPPPPTTVRQP